MKRSEALAILSRDHHQALFVASKLTRAVDATFTAERQRFLDYWNPDGRRHFQLEEELLLPAYAAYADPHDPLVLQVLGDHVEIRSRAQRLAEGAERPAAGQDALHKLDAPHELDALHELGAALSTHVRLEERQLFPKIEAAMPADELLELARRLEREAHGAPS